MVVLTFDKILIQVMKNTAKPNLWSLLQAIFIMISTICLKSGVKASLSRSAAFCFKQQCSEFLLPKYLQAPSYGKMTTRFQSTEQQEDTSIVAVCTAKIQKALETDNVKVVGAYDDPNGSHISVEVVSKKFEGKRAVQRQQLVYKAIWEELQGPVHAVDNMVCKTPDEAQK
jgi:stress-induced morphogen